MRRRGRPVSVDEHQPAPFAAGAVGSPPRRIGPTARPTWAVEGAHSTRGSAAKRQQSQDVDDTVRVHVHTDHAGYVVVTDNIQTGFKASVDGRSALVADADYAGGAVYVEAGTHEVALHYEPPGRQTGARLTGLSAVLLAFAALPPLWWGRIRRFGERATNA